MSKVDGKISAESVCLIGPSTCRARAKTMEKRFPEKESEEPAKAGEQDERGVG